jgi:hypothetical protein
VGNTDREVPAFPAFADAAIFHNLANIHSFSLVVELPKLYQFHSATLGDFLVGRMYDEVARAVEAASFYAYDRLKPIRSDYRVGVAFEDDDFAFTAAVDSDGDIVISRSGSSFRRFHEWYVRLMPSLESLISRVIAAVVEIGNATQRRDPEKALEMRDVTPVKVVYTFGFIAYDFRRPPSDAVERNAAIMTRLLGVVPQNDGHLVAVPRGNAAALEQYGRLDVGLSRWSDNPGGKARENYTVQAPSNRSHSSIWFYFSYTGETFQAPDGTRHVFDASDFLKHFEIPYAEFLRDRALGGFLTDLTESFVFDTTTGGLP